MELRIRNTFLSGGATEYREQILAGVKVHHLHFGTPAFEVGEPIQFRDASAHGVPYEPFNLLHFEQADYWKRIDDTDYPVACVIERVLIERGVLTDDEKEQGVQFQFQITVGEFNFDEIEFDVFLMFEGFADRSAFGEYVVDHMPEGGKMEGQLIHWKTCNAYDPDNAQFMK